MTFTLTEKTINILNNDLLNVIQDYKNSAEWFEEHKTKTLKIHNELQRPFQVIENTHHRYPTMTLNIGSGLIDLINDLYILDDEEMYIDYDF